MNNLPLCSLFPPIALYAETHFRFFRFFPSFLFRRIPDILFDVPRRLDPGYDLPVLLILNEVHRYPVSVVEIAVSVSQPGRTPVLFPFENFHDYILDHSLSEYQRAFLLLIGRAKLPEGEILLNATVTIVSGGKRRTILNDSLPSTSKAPFRCYLSKEPLPASASCSFGDLHVHSNYSQSHVEFGPPLRAISEIASSSGLQFTAITDHSYDLECRVDDYVAKDQLLTRWKLFTQEMKECQSDTMIMLQGEEVSCLNSTGNVVHLCGVHCSEFIPGSRDGARRNAANDHQLVIAEVIDKIHNQGGFAFAAHPGASAKSFQKIFLFRGIWEMADLQNGVDGLQAANGDFEAMWERAKALWICMLQNGTRVPLVAGNDAHGDFNRYRAIKIPFIKVGESFNRYFGYTTTGIYGKPSSSSELIDLLKNGKTFVTSGPALSLSSSPEYSDSIISNAVIRPDALFILADSNEEFGSIRRVTLMGSRIGDKEESTIFQRIYDTRHYKLCQRIDKQAVLGPPAYLRAEVVTAKEDGTARFAATSACYFE